MDLAAEFLVEPFSAGAPGPHVQAAIRAVESTGLVVEVGPFGNTTTGEATIVLTAVGAAMAAALDAGATRVSLSIVRRETPNP
jgi:uncharacterized protein YqgV (UPF0045/DUF77 family)